MSTISSFHSFWFIPLCLLAGATYSWLLYQKREDWSKLTHYVLATFRFLFVSLICFFLLEPVIKTIISEEEKPFVPILIDNSASIPLSEGTAMVDSVKQQALALEKALSSQDIHTKIVYFDDSGSSFNVSSSPIDEKISATINRFELRNLSGLVLFSDGIFNKGLNPAQRSYRIPIHTIGLGDTSERKDAFIKKVRYNKTGFTGNEHPLRVEINQVGFTGKETTVSLKKDGKLIDSKKILFSNSSGIEYVYFKNTVKEEGRIEYQIELEPLDGELTTANNRYQFFMNIMKNKQQIYIIAAAPHPDLKLFQNAITSSDKYELKIIYENDLTGNASQLKNPGMILLHQVPSSHSSQKTLQLIASLKSSKFYVVGNQSSLRKFNKINRLITIEQRGNQVDEVTPFYNVDFDLFNLSTDRLSFLSQAPPIVVPFGAYNAKTTNPVFTQKVGTINTGKPLFVIKKFQDFTEAVLVGEGWWRLRLFEYLDDGKQEGIDEFIYKTIELLSKTENNKLLAVEPIKSEFSTDESVTFSITTKNTLGEYIFNKKVDIKVRESNGKNESVDFVTIEGKDKYGYKKLLPGLYSFEATANVSGKNVIEKGQFTVSKTMLEELNLTANHRLLKEVSKRSEGYFTTLGNEKGLINYLNNPKPSSLIHTQEDFKDLIDQKWLLFVIVFLACTEWLIRKRYNTY